jgi:hypothetical protein
MHTPHRGRTWIVALAAFTALGACTGHITGGDGDGPPEIIDGVPCDDERPVARQLRLLTRREYQNTIRDLLGVDVDTSTIPVEPRPQGFDNTAAAMVITSRHLDAFIALAEDSVERALTTRRAELVPCDAAAADCPRRFVESIGARALRRPLDAEEVDAFTGAFAGRSFDDGVRVALGAMLVSPSFLYRWEIGLTVGQQAQLTPYEVASSMSYLFWGSLPDQALFDAARDGTLATAEERMTQARRMLADPRARDQVADFVGQWLRTDGITASKDASIYPGFTDAVRVAMTEEERRFITEVVFEKNGTFRDLFVSDHVIVNDTLADFYGVPRPGAGGGFAPVPVTPESGRGGLLGLGSVLASHAHSNESSPIKRGVFVRRRLLCQDLPDPPPSLDTTPPGLDPTLTTRERFAAHTADPACSGCHQYIDSVGFGLEGFDGAGARRTVENGRSVDLSGEVLGLEDLGDDTRTPFHDGPGLAALIAESEAAQECLPLQYFRYARGIEVTSDDACTVHNLQLTFTESDLSIQDLLVAIVAQPSFAVRN